MQKRFLGVFACAALFAVSPAKALTYTLANDSSGSVELTGSIETDGTFGVLSNDNLVNWTFNLNIGGSTLTINGPQGVGSDEAILGSDLTATSSGLFFNFADPTPGLLEFLGFDGFVCFQNQFACLSDHAYIDSTLLLDIFGNPIDTLGPIPESGNVEFAVAETPLPGALSLFASGLGVIGLLARRRKRKAPLAA